MFIQTETTSDLAKMRFSPGREVLAQGSLNLNDKTQAAKSPLAERLFAIEGVAAVSLSKESITITKGGGDWRELKPAILGAIMEHFLSGAPVLHSAAEVGISLPETRANGSEAPSADRIREALCQVIDPELGYNIVDLGLVYDIAIAAGGGVTITMTTTTPGCPATNYLKQGAGDAAISVDGVECVEVVLTYEPRWTPEAMAPDAKAHFGIE